MSLKAETRLVVPIEKPRRTLWRKIRQRPELVLTPLVLVVFLAIWEWVSTSGLVSPVILPTPPKVFRGIVTLVKASWFPQHLWTTTIETALGFCIAGASAFTMAVFLHQVPLLRRVVYPYVVTFQVMPMIVLAPIFVVWFGFGITSKVVVSITTAFFVVLVNSLAGLAAVPENSLLLMRSLVATRRQVLFKLTIPTSLPYLFAGLKTAATLALIGALVGEFVTAEKGLGRLLTQFSFALKQELVFATVIWVGALGLVLYGIVSFLEKKLVWWR